MLMMMQAMMGAATVPLASGPAFDPSAFVFTIRVENDGDSFTWPDRGGTYDATFDWGDGSSDHVTAAPSAHVYAVAGDYDVAITGTCPAPSPFTPDWVAMLTTIKQWGAMLGASNWLGAFDQVSNTLQITATDVFGSGVVDTSYMFYGVTIDGDLSNWDVSSVTNMESMFASSSFDSDISGWDVSSVTNMDWMFVNSTFDGDISGWCVTLIDSEPTDFAAGGALQSQHYPVWGTCP